ncbi:hypothetical protein [Streptomyces broussonetiae]|uniref:hypothetical protein n=1 Tax=Streptomyces broussonetiae TaxID=2686304 RepID=UPI0035D99316
MRRSSQWGWFLAWLAVGGCLALGLVTLLTVGVVLLVVGGAAAVLLLRKGHRDAAVGGLAGLGLPLFYLAYLNRGGPGNVCQVSASGSTCTDEYAPVPFLVAGAVLVAAGFVVFLLREHRHRGTG